MPSRSQFQLRMALTLFHFGLGQIHLTTGEWAAETATFENSCFWLMTPSFPLSLGIEKPSFLWLDWSTLSLRLPFWVPWLVAMAVSLGAKSMLARRRPTNLCAECGYNLTGNVSGRCPECGTSIVE